MALSSVQTCVLCYLKNCYFFILMVAMVSLLLTYHIGTQTLQMAMEEMSKTGSLKLQFREVSLKEKDEDQSDNVGSVWRRSLHMHPLTGSSDSNILNKLVELEDNLLRTTKQRRVAVVGKQDASKMSGLVFALHKLQYHIKPFPDQLTWVDESTLLQGNLSVVLCADDQQGSVELTTKELSNLSKRSIKVNRSPALTSFLSNTNNICKLSRIIHKKQEVGDKNQDCFIMEEEKNYSPEHFSTDLYLSVSMSRDKSVWDHSNLAAFADFLNRFRGVLWRLPGNLLKFEGGPLLKFYTLLTSFLPLRVYLYPIVKSTSLTQSLDTGQQKMFHVKDLLQAVSNGIDSGQVLVDTIKMTIVQYLLATEVALVSTRNSSDHKTLQCRGCFQVLEMEMICQTVFRCDPVQVKPVTLTSLELSHSHHLDKMMDCVAAMIVTERKVAGDVAKGLKKMDVQLEMDGGCEADNNESVCLTVEDLLYLLDQRREQLTDSNFIMVYPDPGQSKYSSVFDELQKEPIIDFVTSQTAHDSTSTQSSGPIKTSHQLFTVRLHPLLTKMEKFYKHLDSDENDKRTDSRYSGKGQSENIVKMDITQEKKIKHNLERTTDTKKRHSCSIDDTDMPYLSDIFSEPKLSLTESRRNIYTTSVPYKTIMIKMWGTTKHCQAEARIGDREGSHVAVNLTLGLGENRISVYIVDLLSAPPVVVNTYILLIERQPQTIQPPIMFSPENLQVSSLKQDCSLPFSPTETCGLHIVKNYSSWLDYLNQSTVFPRCQSGDHPGKWYVPCQSSSEENTCHWKHSKWQPMGCQYKQLQQQDIKQCLKGKKLLFVGDSTNRGMLHYILEVLNGTLMEWDKTHTTRIYRNLNSNQTLFVFAYYPHFWLPRNHRPTFDKVLYQLIRSSHPLDNNHNTVMVVGGVQWLAKQHLDIIMAALKREGLSNITKIVKGVGAGFHQLVKNVRYVSKEGQPALMGMEQEILEYAKQNGFHGVATYNMTVSRYKDFHPGKCACHFHQVTKVRRDDGRYENPGYHVTGDINAVYSNILLNLICDSPG
ncbi:hypothetical protein CHS0354_008994 [Potamilus streckersoni]|uniref:NXPE C-terminal domain-containing protein n=1 Tax=Potamilus streckersoni TaxID=2493646 RepID=A0AAE0WCS9_9BIVA|nr:hypothetical protein CHS0354_008994 [Potamilus streckersoni]